MSRGTVDRPLIGATFWDKFLNFSFFPPSRLDHFLAVLGDPLAQDLLGNVAEIKEGWMKIKAKTQFDLNNCERSDTRLI